jgi:hypothetical protein
MANIAAAEANLHEFRNAADIPPVSAAQLPTWRRATGQPPHKLLQNSQVGGSSRAYRRCCCAASATILQKMRCRFVIVSPPPPTIGKVQQKEGLSTLFCSEILLSDTLIITLG